MAKNNIGKLIRKGYLDTRVCLTLLGFLFLFPAMCAAGESVYHVRKLTIDEGFSENFGYGIIKDSCGFIWKAGFYYLDRYDGYEVKSYLIGDKNKNFVGDRIINLFEDKIHDLWVISDKGFLRYNRISDSFYLIPYEYSSEPYCVDENNTIWLAKNGLCVLNREEGKVKRIVTLQDSVSTITPMGNELWLSVKDKIVRFDKTTLERSYFQPITKSTVNSYKNILKDPNGLLWILDDKRLFLYNPGNFQYWEWKFDELPGNEIPCRLTVDMSGNLWIASESGCYMFPFSKDRIIRFKHDPNDPNSIQSDLITGIFVDNHNILWLTTLQNGIASIDLSQKPFGKISRIPYGSNTLSGNSVYAMTEGPGETIWIGTENGLDQYNYTTRAFTPVHFPNGKSYWVDYLTTDKEGTIYFATKNSKVLRIFHPVKGLLESYELPVEEGIIRCILPDESGKVYVGLVLSSDPLVQFDVKSMRFTKMLSGELLKTASGNVLHIIRDNTGLIWFGIKSGCLLYDPFAMDFKYLPIGTDEMNSSGAIPFVHYIHQQKDNNKMWFATANGLYLMKDRESGLLKKYDQANGFPSNSIQNILEDLNGNLWLGTDRGLCKFNPESESCKNYSTDDGIQGNYFEHFAACNTKSGKLCFGGTNGFNIFSPGQIVDNPFKPQVIIKGFKIFYNLIHKGDTIRNRILLPGSIEVTKKVTLKATEKAFSILYAGLHYAYPEGNQYAYYLEGFEDDYNYVGTRREATYTNLSAGHYVFHIKASNNDGIWNEKEAKLTIVILPPWYRTIWAIIGYILIIAALFYAAIRIVIYENHLKNNIRLEKLSKEKEQELNQMKLRFFTNISHEFKTPLTLINGYIDQIATLVKGDQVIKEKLAKARLNSQRLLKLINQLIDFRKSEQDVLRLNKRNEDIVQVTRQVVDSFQAFADQNNITLSLHPEMDSFLVLIDRDKIEDVLYNIISNAIKFNYPNGEVDVSINQDKRKSMLLISVADTGIGMAPQNMEKLFDRFYQINDQPISVPVTQTGSGIGLSFSKKLIELHGGTITAESTLGKGSVFRISIPIGIDPTQAIPQVVPVKMEPESLRKEELSHNQRVVLSDKNAPVILVVEDNSEMREFICSILWDEYRVEEAENGKTGLDMAVQDNPHLIISDIMMPVMDGIAMCKALKTNLSTSHIPVVLLSAKNDIDTKLESMGLNADDFIEKPFSPEYLKARVKNILEIRENLKSHFSQGNEDVSKLNGLNPVDQQFLEKSNKIIEERISDPDFSVNALARELSLNRVQLYRKFSSITGLLPKDYIKQIRLNKAAKLLRERQLTVAEIGYAVGYSAPSNFNFAFKAYYGKTPKEYQEGF